MAVFCWQFIKLSEKNEALIKENKPTHCGIWSNALLTTSQLLGHLKKNSQKPGERRSRDLQKWLCDFIQDCKELPICDWNTLGHSFINDEDLLRRSMLTYYLRSL
jgi:hypothetical protein